MKKLYKKTYKEIFLEHINNDDDYKNSQDLYELIEKEYVNKINSGMNIRIEKASLERYINQCKITSVHNYIAFYLLAITVLINGIITAYTQYKGFINNYYYIIAFSTIMFITIILIGLSSSKEFAGEDRKAIVLKLCLRILNDIEQEMVEQKAKDEVVSAFQEIAVTKESKDNFIKRFRKFIQNS